jgi:hypothetical protein
MDTSQCLLRPAQVRDAYARFKDLLAAEECLDKWYAYESESTERALR